MTSTAARWALALLAAVVLVPVMLGTIGTVSTLGLAPVHTTPDAGPGTSVAHLAVPAPSPSPSAAASAAPDASADLDALDVPAASAASAASGQDPVAAVEAIIAPWCAGVPVTLRSGGSSHAGYTRSTHPILSLFTEPEEFITLGLRWPTDHPGTHAVALHECAHILQYRAHGHDQAALAAAMSALVPANTANTASTEATARPGADPAAAAIEHMADCLAEAMGAQRTGMVDGVAYSAGYGGACTPDQAAAAAQILSSTPPVLSTPPASESHPGG